MQTPSKPLSKLTGPASHGRSSDTDWPVCSAQSTPAQLQTVWQNWALREVNPGKKHQMCGLGWSRPGQAEHTDVQAQQSSRSAEIEAEQVLLPLSWLALSAERSRTGQLHWNRSKLDLA